MTEPKPGADRRTSRPRPKRLRQHTNPLAFQGATERPDWNTVLGGPPEELEIGFGLGELLLDRAAMRPGSRICGIDVRWAYVERVREEAAALPRPLPNLYFVHAEGKLALSKWIDPGTLKHAIVYFPDPWFKKRHEKRRIINPEVVSLIAGALAPRGLLHVATDQEPLGHSMLEIISAEPRLRNVVGPNRFAPESAIGAQSGREIEHIRRGERIWRMLFERV